MNFLAKAKPNVTIEAILIKADGTRIDLGVIAETRLKKKKLTIKEILMGMGRKAGIGK